jgi:histidinol-phosphatase
MSVPIDLELALETARLAAQAAARVALPYFERGVKVELKGDDTPVTAADRESETAILAVIRKAFPTHAILAEETGAHAGDARTRWIVDPLDGTRGFTRGGIFWGPLIALEHAGEVVAGAFALPVLGEFYWGARGKGCFKNSAPLRVSTISTWKDATLSLGELRRMLAMPEAAGISELIRSSASTRSFGDPGAPAMVLSGRAECWLEAGVKTWDLAPFKVLIEEAGGRFTCFAGTPSIETGNAIGTNGVLHEHVLRALRDGARAGARA